MPRNHILWSSAHIKAILMKIIFNFEKSGPAKTGLAGLVAMALRMQTNDFTIGLQQIPVFGIQIFGCLNERIPNYLFTLTEVCHSLLQITIFSVQI